MRLQMTSLRWRIFSLYVGILGLLLCGMAVLIHAQAESLFISSRATEVRETVHWALNQSEPKGELSVNDINDVAERLSVSMNPDFSFFLFDNRGGLLRVLGQGDRDLGTSPSPYLAYAGMITEGKEIKSVVPAGDRAYRRLLYTLPVYDPPGHVLGAIQTEVRLDKVDKALATLSWVLCLGFGAAFVGTCTLWYFLTKAAFKPLENLARISRAAAAGDFARRAVVPKSKGEVREVALAFNQMLDNIERYIGSERQNQERMKQFLADASHEFRSPLTVLRGYVDVLLRGATEDPSALKGSLEAMRDAILRMTRLTNDLLTLSRLEAGVELNLAELDVTSLCQETCEIAQTAADDREVVFQRGPPMTIRGDAELLKRVLWNLLDNSIRHTTPDGRIQVSAVQYERHCRIAVSDDGEGIPPEHLPHIFERFYRAEQTHHGGFGLGLAIAKAIVDAHGGRIAVESTVGRGTTFMIDLPLAV